MSTNYHNHNGNIQPAPGASSALYFNRFRLQCRRADATVALVGIYPTLAGAVNVAREHLGRLRLHRERIVRDAERPRLLYVERWVGTSSRGGWEEVLQQEGGYRFEFLDRAPRLNRARRGSGPLSTLLASRSQVKQASVARDGATPVRGDRVSAVLLEQRTRKGGWFAKLVGYSASGPIGNWRQMPAACRPGDQLDLVLCGIKLESGYATFRWVAE